MTILITGGAGYIGSHMVLDLIAIDEAIVVLDDLSAGFAGLVPNFVPFIKGDIGDKSLVKSIIESYGINSILHFAAKIVVPDSMSDPLGYYLNNTSKARTLIEAAVETGIKDFIFSSTAAVYGGTDATRVTEETPTDPISPYGRSKLMVEWMLQDAARAHGLNAMILRYFNVAGADPAGRSGQSTPRATHLIKTACEAAIGKRVGMSVFGTDYATPDGTCLRDYIHVSDLARAHRLSLEFMRAGGKGTVLNCGYGHGYSVLEVIQAVKSVSGVDFPVTLAGRRAGDPQELVATGEKIRSLLGWKPFFDDLGMIVADALEWEKILRNTSQIGQLH
jgi:UDP-glucose 4-epimerase